MLPSPISPSNSYQIGAMESPDRLKNSSERKSLPRLALKEFHFANGSTGGEMGREAMNAPSKMGKRSSKECLMKKSEAKKKPTQSINPLKDLNGGSVPPPLGSSEASRGGCFRFLLSHSSDKESLARSKPAPRTQSAPSNSRNVASNAKNPTIPSRYQTFQKNASKSNVEADKQLGSWKALNPRNGDLFQRCNKRKHNSNCKNPEKGLEGKIGSCLVSTHQRPFGRFDAHVGFESTKEGEQNLMSTPTSATIPPVQASISPEVPVKASAADAAPVCFAAGHVIARVHDRGKCRARGILIGEREPEVEKVRGGCTDRTRASVTPPPPPAEASMHWLSSPSENVDMALCSSFNSSSEVLAAEASVDWLLSPCKDGEGVHKDALLMGNRTSPDRGSWRFFPGNSIRERSPELSGLMSLDSPSLETTPSSGIGIQKTPSTGGSVSPFSMILERIAKSSKAKLVRPQQETGRHRNCSVLEDSLFSGNSWIEGHVTCKPSFVLSSRKKYDLADFKMDAMAESLESVRLSPEPLSNDASCQAPLPGLSFQFECHKTNSVDFNHLQNLYCDRISIAKDASAEEEVLPSSQTRVSWREEPISRVFEMGELDHCQWLSDDDNFVHHEEHIVAPIPDLKSDCDSSSSILKNRTEPIAPVGFGYVVFVSEAKRSETEVSPQGPISCAESIGMEGLVLDSSGDSDWTLFYKNHLLEV
ncbi:hypothetical protein BHE74_00023214 [Ensete ventricosum]|nr:hypothetical protein BHE74_00023214 [Ensete ventricosum]